MALFPCDRHGSRRPGPNYLAYVAVLDTLDVARYRLRLCADHSFELQERLHQFEVDPNGFTVRDSSVASHCLGCMKPIGEERWQVFVTHYVSKDDRKDYWSQIHTQCALPPLLSKPKPAYVVA